MDYTEEELVEVLIPEAKAKGDKEMLAYYTSQLNRIRMEKTDE